MTRAEALSAARDAARTATEPEALVRGAMTPLFDTLGDRTAHLRPGALDPGQHQYFVAGGFFATPDRRHQMLVGSIGFPPEQERLCVPIDGGDPGQVLASGEPLLIADTRRHGRFRQYLKTSRMGSAILTPLLREGRPFGLIMMAAQAGGTMDERDLASLTALAPEVAAAWDRLGGPDWLDTTYAAALTEGRAWIATER